MRDTQRQFIGFLQSQESLEDASFQLILNVLELKYTILEKCLILNII